VQLSHLADLAEERDNVTVQVFPLGAGLHPGLHGTFSIMEFGWPDDPGIVFVETIPDHPAYYTSRGQVYAFAQAFESITAIALSPTETLEMIRRLAGSRRSRD
jgi:hypothetical protein